MSKLHFLITMLLFALLLAGCSVASQPTMIASYPSESRVESPGSMGLPPPPAQYVYDAYIELDVTNADRAAGRAVDLTYSYGGYLVSSQAWSSDDKQHTTLVLAVPVANFDETYNSLVDLGTPVNEHISGEWVSTGAGNEWTVYSEITLQLNSKETTWFSFSGTRWSPLNTAQSAFNVFITIFGFLVDILIWIVVVIGPFLVIAYIARRVVRKLRATP